MFLRPREIADKMGVSGNFIRKIIQKAKPDETKDEKTGKTLFDYDSIVKFIQLVGK